MSKYYKISRVLGTATLIMAISWSSLSFAETKIYNSVPSDTELEDALFESEPEPETSEEKKSAIKMRSLVVTSEKENKPSKKYVKPKKIKRKSKRKTNAGVAFPIQFANNSAVLRGNSKAYLDGIGRVLEKRADKKILIEGHTDAKGLEDDNQLLSEMRADAVINYLVTHFNISVDRLKSSGKGEQKLRFSPYDGRNRRVEIKPLN